MPISTVNGMYYYNGRPFKTLQEAKEAELQDQFQVINPAIPASSGIPVSMPNMPTQPQRQPSPQGRNPNGMGGRVAPNLRPQPNPSNMMKDMTPQSMRAGGGLLDTGGNKPAPTAEPSFFDRLTSKEGIGAIGNAMLAMSQDPALQKMGMAGMERMQARKQSNRTLEFLKAKGVDDATLQTLKDNPQMINAFAASVLRAPKVGTLEQGYEYAKSQGYKGSIDDYLNLKKPATEVNVNTGADTDELRKKLQGQEGETWAGFLKSGNKGAELMSDLNALQQLSQVAPNGALTGRFAEMFPELNDNAAAFTAIVKRMAPSMRVEGSGSTSDIEVQMMLDSLGSLKNSPEANAMIYDAFRKKIALNQARAEIVAAFNVGTYTYEQASSKLNEINRQSVMTPELKRLTSSTEGSSGTQGTGTKPEWMDQSVWDIMSESERRKF